MQYVWQYRLFNSRGLTTVDGKRLSIISPGLLNTGPGPDFFNASIEIDGQRWVGNVEIHVRASDWHRHGHDSDRAYDSVILHVVDYDDTMIRRPDGQIIPQMRMPCVADLNVHYNRLTVTAPVELPCAETIKATQRMYLVDWLGSLAYERIYDKVDRINEQLERCAGDWEETAYICLARALGMGINAEPFERLARSLPLHFLRKHADSLLSVESLFFGQAGLIPVINRDDYAGRLMEEYKFLANKFGLKPPENLGWKFSGVRPASFPYRRLAYLSKIVVHGNSIISMITGVKTLEEARELFRMKLTGFWENHYNFNSVSPTYTNALNADIIIINAVVPLLFAYGNSRGDNEMVDFAVSLLEELPAEKNRLVEMFLAAGIKPQSAFTSQALIQLRRQYCEQRKCIFCRIGHRQLSAAAIRH